MKPYIKFVAVLFHGWDITLSSCLAVSWPDIFLFWLIVVPFRIRQALLVEARMCGKENLQLLLQAELPGAEIVCYKMEKN